MPRKKIPTKRPKKAQLSSVVPFKKRPRGAAFKKGHPKHGGRQKGVGNLVTRELKDFFSEFYASEDYKASLRQRILDGKSQSVEVMGWGLTVGKPTETVEIKHSESFEELYAIAAAKGLNGK